MQRQVRDGRAIARLHPQWRHLHLGRGRARDRPAGQWLPPAHGGRVGLGRAGRIGGPRLHLQRKQRPKRRRLVSPKLRRRPRETRQSLQPRQCQFPELGARRHAAGRGQGSQRTRCFRHDRKCLGTPSGDRSNPRRQLPGCRPALVHQRNGQSRRPHEQHRLPPGPEQCPAVPRGQPVRHRHARLSIGVRLAGARRKPCGNLHQRLARRPVLRCLHGPCLRHPVGERNLHREYHRQQRLRQFHHPVENRSRRPAARARHQWPPRRDQHVRRRIPLHGQCHHLELHHHLHGQRTARRAYHQFHHGSDLGNARHGREFHRHPHRREPKPPTKRHGHTVPLVPRTVRRCRRRQPLRHACAAIPHRPHRDHRGGLGRSARLGVEERLLDRQCHRHRPLESRSQCFMDQCGEMVQRQERARRVGAGLQGQRRRVADGKFIAFRRSRSQRIPLAERGGVGMGGPRRPARRQLHLQWRQLAGRRCLVCGQ